jgi:hypothetical protein
MCIDTIDELKKDREVLELLIEWLNYKMRTPDEEHRDKITYRKVMDMIEECRYGS